MDFAKIKEQVIVLAVEQGSRVLLAIAVLFIGIRLIRNIKKLIAKGLEKYSSDQTLKSFLSNLSSWVLQAILFISIAQMFGIETTSFVAILGAVGLAIGLALQGMLTNFAGGIMLLVFRPYQIGATVEIKDTTGKVVDIQIFSTILEKFDGKTVYIPNGGIMNDKIVNWTKKGFLRFDLLVKIPLDADLDKAMKIIREVLTKEEKVLEEPKKPFVGLREITDYSMDIRVRAWGKIWSSFGAKRAVIIACKRALEAEGIKMPYPHMGVYMHQPPTTENEIVEELGGE